MVAGGAVAGRGCKSREIGAARSLGAAKGGRALRRHRSFSAGPPVAPAAENERNSTEWRATRPGAAAFLKGHMRRGASVRAALLAVVERFESLRGLNLRP